VNLFLYLVVAWWIFYRWRNQQPWPFFLFVFVLISPRFRRYPVKGHFASSRIETALLHRQHPLFRRTSDRRDYAE
jgi:hypothetical protein